MFFKNNDEDTALKRKLEFLKFFRKWIEHFAAFFRLNLIPHGVAGSDADFARVCKKFEEFYAEADKYLKKRGIDTDPDKSDKLSWL